MSASRVAKSAYVSTLRGVRGLARATGIYGALQRRLPDRGAHWWLSLFAIHDIDAMVDLDVPWWSYDAIDKVDAFLAERPKARVFEYGSGASTIWAARRAYHITSVEHDADWYPIISGRLKPFSNVDLKLIEPDTDYDAAYGSTKPGNTERSFRSYVTSIEDAGGPFDMIVIDGRARVACLRQALDYLAPGGIIVFDNSGRREYRAPIEAVKGQVDTYRGRVPSLPYYDQTTLIMPDAANER